MMCTKTRGELRYRLVSDDTDCTVNYSELSKKFYVYDYCTEHAKPKLVYRREASQLNNRTHVPLQERNYTNELALLGSPEYMNQQCFLCGCRKCFTGTAFCIFAQKNKIN
jgi:hypothetical protein